MDLEGATVLDLAGVSLLDVDAGSITPVVDCNLQYTRSILVPPRPKMTAGLRIALVYLPCNFYSRVYSREQSRDKRSSN